MLFVTLAVWSGCMIFLHYPSTPLYAAEIVFRVYVLCWFILVALTLRFLFMIAGRFDLINKPYFYAFMILPPALFYVLYLNGMFLKPVTGFFSGWYAEWQNNIWNYLYYLYYFFCSAAGVYQIIASMKSTAYETVRKQKAVIAATVSISVLISTVLALLLPLKYIYLGDLTDIAILIWAAGIIYSIVHLRMFRITAAYAADKIVGNMREFLIITDTDNRIVTVNKYLLDFLGFKEYELLDKSTGLIAGPGSDFKAVFEEAVRADGCRMEEFNLKNSAGENVPVVLSASPVLEKNKAAGMVCLGSDISGILKTRDNLKKSNDKLIELDSLKSNFSAMISHELRTPLTSINGFLSFLIRGAAGEPNPKQKEYLGIIKNNSDRLLSLINDLLDMSKIESGTFSIQKNPASMNLVIKQSITDIKSLADSKNITIKYSEPENQPMVDMDFYRMSQVVLNLLSNSIKFSPVNSQIGITYGTIPLSQAVIPARAAGKNLRDGVYAAVSITDHGPGISTENLEKVFDRFFQAGNSSQKPKGTGLGLNIVKNIVEIHGGAVWAESEGIDKGSVFKFLIPGKM